MCVGLQTKQNYALRSVSLMIFLHSFPCLWDLRVWSGRQ